MRNYKTAVVGTGECEIIMVTRKNPDFMQNIMQAFRGNIKEFGGKKVVKLLDYAPGLDGLPKSDVLKFRLEDNCSIVVRPSGTEPKLKTYIIGILEVEERNLVDI